MAEGGDRSPTLTHIIPCNYHRASKRMTIKDLVNKNTYKFGPNDIIETQRWGIPNKKKVEVGRREKINWPKPKLGKIWRSPTCHDNRWFFIFVNAPQQAEWIQQTLGLIERTKLCDQKQTERNYSFRPRHREEWPHFLRI